MSVQRFVGKSSRAVLKDVRTALGDDAVILSNRTSASGVEVLAIGAHDMDHLVENAAQPRPARTMSAAPAARTTGAAPTNMSRPSQSASVGPAAPETFESYLKRAHGGASHHAIPAAARPGQVSRGHAAAAAAAAAEYESIFSAQMDDPVPVPGMPGMHAAHTIDTPAPARAERRDTREPSLLERATSAPAPSATKPAVDPAVMAELKSMRGMLQDQLAQMAWTDLTRKSPVQAKLLARMIQSGFSPVLARAVIERLPGDTKEHIASEWLTKALIQNLICARSGEDMIERGGIYALVGPTGVGKTTTAAKLAARAAMRYGVKNLGLITIDCYRIGAQDQLRSFGKILGCPVHVAHDAASLNDLLLGMREKRMVLIDTVGMPQRDPQLNEQLSMLMGPGIERVMVLNASAQAETLEEVVQAWRGPRCTRAIISKIDEAVKLGGVVDALIRHRLTLNFVTNGQRVPEDMHAANANLLVDRALRASTTAVFQLQPEELTLVATAGAATTRETRNAG
jgi:flagellar biosynthesis protein FlhF